MINPIKKVLGKIDGLGSLGRYVVEDKGDIGRLYGAARGMSYYSALTDDELRGVINAKLAKGGSDPEVARYSSAKVNGKALGYADMGVMNRIMTNFMDANGSGHADGTRVAAAFAAIGAAGLGGYELYNNH